MSCKRDYIRIEQSEGEGRSSGNIHGRTAKSRSEWKVGIRLRGLGNDGTCMASGPQERRCGWKVGLRMTGLGMIHPIAGVGMRGIGTLEG